MLVPFDSSGSPPSLPDFWVFWGYFAARNAGLITKGAGTSHDEKGRDGEKSSRSRDDEAVGKLISGLNTCAIRVCSYMHQQEYITDLVDNKHSKGGNYRALCFDCIDRRWSALDWTLCLPHAPDMGCDCCSTEG